LKFSDIIQTEILKFAFKLHNGKTPLNISSFFDIRQSRHTYNTRQKNDCRNVKHSTALFNKSLLNKTPIEWSKIDANNKNIKTLKTFNATIKNNILERY
jgi:hypothetical protein